MQLHRNSPLRVAMMYGDTEGPCVCAGSSPGVFRPLQRPSNIHMREASLDVGCMFDRFTVVQACACFAATFVYCHLTLGWACLCMHLPLASHHHAQYLCCSGMHVVQQPTLIQVIIHLCGTLVHGSAISFELFMNYFCCGLLRTSHHTIAQARISCSNPNQYIVAIHLSGMLVHDAP